MGHIDRIPAIQPVHLQTQPTSSVHERKEGRNSPEQEHPHDRLELHEEEIPTTEPVPHPNPEIEPEHGLDLSA